ncbi:hypothetical protein [Flavilitoribacter nigricans]|uniref:Uncharacterized protein n=1 Tax=Flavilitoribacter nigricans (strain ATCC 23147 / DSM 23189 / NBRC 102662 / NCIMB 1420 / SS-2) TaxID=1122177 RepID=A0A2D0NEJ9_FLAN2|nr:hypothetical protein [Flavilitoribacter nigricans]PHN06934.1 hypothetical protein CRP01_08955 [Flavilitoribacter nigricans DSM 23189 = NBRC 102662]
MKSFFLTILLSVTTLATTTAQDLGSRLDVDLLPNYIITIIAGIVLALGFQFLLTSLSVSFGFTAIGDLKEKYVQSKYRSDYNEDSSSERDDDDDDNKYDIDPGTPVGVDLASGIGLWNVLTVAPSLFGATALALLLTPMDSLRINITLALVVWAAFIILVIYLEGRSASVLIGGLVNTALSGLKASGQAVKSLLTPSPQTQMENVAASTVEKIRQEFSLDFDAQPIVATLEKYLGAFNERVPSYESLKNDIREIAETSAGNNPSSNPAKWTAIQTAIQTAIESDNTNPTRKGREKVQQLQSLLKDIQDAYQRGNTRGESIKNAVEASPIDHERINSYYDQLKNWIQRSTPDKLSREQIKRELEKIIDDPGRTVRGLRAKLDELDRDTVIGYLDSNTQLERDQLETYADRIEQGLQALKDSIGWEQLPSADEMLNRLEQRIAHFINSTDDPRLNYAMLKNDFSTALNNPSESLSILKTRLSRYDRDTLVSILTNTGLVSRDDLDQVANTVEEARQQVLDQISQIEDKSKRALRNLEKKAVIQAENTRQTASTAAWWLTFTILAGAAAAIGGAFAAV